MRVHPKRSQSEHVSGIIDSVLSFGLPDRILFPLMRILGRAKGYAVTKYFDRDGHACLAMKAFCVLTGQPLSSYVRDGAFFHERYRSVEDALCIELGITGTVLHDLIAAWDNASYTERSEALSLLEQEGAAYLQNLDVEEAYDLIAEPFDLQRGTDDQLAEQIAVLRGTRFASLTRAPLPQARTFATAS